MPAALAGVSFGAMSDDARLLVAYGSKYGATAQIVEAIGMALRTAGFTVDVSAARQVRALDPHQAVVLGSAVHAGRWRRDAMRLLRRPQLRDRREARHEGESRSRAVEARLRPPGRRVAGAGSMTRELAQPRRENEELRREHLGLRAQVAASPHEDADPVVRR
jgi:hypothetical protein